MLLALYLSLSDEGEQLGHAGQVVGEEPRGDPIHGFFHGFC